MKREWTYRELDILRREFPVRKTEDVARMIGRSVQATSVKASLLGLKKKHHGIQWTPQMLKLLREFFPTMFNKPLARWIGVSERSLIRKARELGIEKKPGFLAERKDDISRLASDALKKAYREGRLTSVFQKGTRNNPAGEFKPGNKESPETKAKRSEALRKTHRRKKMMKIYGIKM